MHGQNHIKLCKYPVLYLDGEARVVTDKRK